MKTEQIARIAHEINRAYCGSLGDTSVPAWEDASEHQRASVLAGVNMHLGDPNVTPEQSHEAWLAMKTADGWTYGPEKNAEAKEHPCMVPYAELPPEQRAKDSLFKAVVALMKPIDETRQNVVVAQPVEIPANHAAMVPVKYIGHREVYVEGAYGTRLTFHKGETIMVPAGKASLLLKHPDVYVLGEGTGAAGFAAVPEASPAKKDNEAEQLEATRDAITHQFNKAQLAAFAKTNFRLDLDPVKMTKEAMRERVLQLVDQFGVA